MKKHFFKHQAQTSAHPLALEISHANGSYVYDSNKKAYLDFIAGVSANTLGHNYPKISQAIKDQVDNYTHVMVYGEFIQQPQVTLCKLLADNLPDKLETVYLTNSGTEATEGALKLAKRFTGRSEIIAAKNGYHGNTQGAMSVCGAEVQNNAFRPLIPGIRFIEFNNSIDLDKITTKTAAVILETIQGGAGFIEPINNYLQKVLAKCNKVGALLILDEIQSGIGRTGKLFGFENYNITPDIIIAGKGLGGGMPIGAFISSFEIMDCLKQHPKLGHITTFGGHPVIAAAANATLKELLNANLIEETLIKEVLFRKLLIHPLITEIRGKGLMLAAMVETPEIASKVILKCLDKGLLLFWLLFEGKAIRITPPLTITKDEIIKGCNIIIESLNKILAD
ncbi:MULTISPECIES: aspartate aminotransferase family protein [Flavobacteriaceae]|uniref:Aspartate aminotransferase family protein n=2 Tax=Flavobacteriaceae TaxID=49546 RepID=A0A4Y8AXD9_9FLAO|nr:MULTISPECIES: aspartate aminotransferase family protein [Flavobacteriaceae]TEW76805.1 aspartate aminotransferase family protein [Gramella jeungdoensis]GGK49844.1 aspartate aminotransferase family protein [Lutibacter litoralis]